jgi:hypothetical protein
MIRKLRNHPNLVKTNDWTHGAHSMNDEPVPHEKLEPKPFRLIEPQYERAIVCPWLSTVAKWQELKYMLRSIHKFFEDKECPIIVICDKAPKWFKPGGRLQFIEVTQYEQSKRAGLWEAVQQGYQIANEVGWWNDDIYLLKDVGWEDIRVALSLGEFKMTPHDMRRSQNEWLVNVGHALEDLNRTGIKDIKNVATHTPYLFEIEKSREIMSTYHLRHRGSWVTLYHNHHGTPTKPCLPEKTKDLPAKPATASFLNHGHSGPTSNTRRGLQKMLSDKAPWEK